MSALSTEAMDKRPFKGKGASGWLARCEKELAQVVSEMKHLSGETKRITGSPWYLCLHLRHKTGQHFLMWRSYGKTKHVHLQWEQMQGILKRMSPEQRDWYRDVNDWARYLNAHEKAARAALNLAKGLMGVEE